LLDTNILSEPIRPKHNQNVLDRLDEHQDEIATATIYETFSDIVIENGYKSLEK